jgi:hypothetical protein
MIEQLAGQVLRREQFDAILIGRWRNSGRGALELADEPTAAPSIPLALMQSVNQFTFRSEYESLMFGSVQSAARERCLNKLRREMLAGGLCLKTYF